MVQNGRQLLLLVGDKEAWNTRQVTADVVKGSAALLQQRNNHFHNLKFFFMKMKPSLVSVSSNKNIILRSCFFLETEVTIFVLQGGAGEDSHRYASRYL